MYKLIRSTNLRVIQIVSQIGDHIPVYNTIDEIKKAIDRHQAVPAIVAIIVKNTTTH